MIRRDARFFAFAEAFFFAAANGIADGFIGPIGGFDVDGATAHRRAVVLFDSFLVTAFDFNVSPLRGGEVCHSADVLSINMRMSDPLPPLGYSP